MLKITKLKQTEKVYDLTVKNTHNFIANGIVVHNCEILHPTKPLQHIDDEEAEIGCCLVEGTKILTKNGIKNIENISSSDKVYVPFNDDENLSLEPSFERAKLINNGVKHVYKITTHQGQEIEATNDHKFLVKTGVNKDTFKTPKYEWKKVKDLSSGDLLVSPNKKSITNNSIEDDEEYLSIGLMIGDGWYTNTSYGCCFNSSETEALEVYSSQMKKWYKDCKIDRDTQKIHEKQNLDSKTYSLATSDTNVKNFLCKKYGFKPGKAFDKKITKELFNTTIEQQANILSGLFCADGCVTIFDRENGKKRVTVSLTSCSKELLQNSQIILSQFGIKAGVYMSYEDQGTLRIEDKESLINFQKYINFRVNERKSQKLDIGIQYKKEQSVYNKGNLQTYKINNIKSVGYKQVYDLSIENGRHFLANDVVVHNCILSGINLLETKQEEYEDICDIIVRMLDELIEIQDYPIKATETFSKNKRSLGIGVTNLAALLAKNKIRYEDEASLTFIDEIFEQIQYNLLLASNNLAKEKGPCNDFSSSAYSNFEFSWEKRQKYLDEIVPFEVYCEWEALRDSIRAHGLRHSTLSCVFPSESSSVIHGATNGIEPPRQLLSYKKSKSGLLPYLVPMYGKYKNFYSNAFEVPNSRYSEIGGIILRWFDMAISLNHYYDYEKYDGNIPISELIKDMFYHYKCGNKTLYYTNTKDSDEESGCESGACAL